MSTRSKAALLALLALAQFISALDYNIVYVALPEIGRALAFPEHQLQWVISAYAVAFGGFLLLGGRAADVLGRRRVFVTALGLYGVSSLVGGLATSTELLIGARAVQGVGGALLMPATLSLIATHYAEGRERNRALAYWGGAGSVGLALGSLAGGVLTEYLGWESVFFVNVPLAAAAALAAFALVPRDGARSGRSLQVLPASLATLAMTSGVFVLVQGPESGWLTVTTIAAAVVALVAGLAAARAQRVSSDPLVSPALLRNANLRVAMAITFVFMGTFGSQYYIVTVYLQDVLALDALRTGLAFLPAALTALVGTQAAGPVLGRFGIARTLMGSLVVGGVGMVAFALAVSDDGGYAALLPGIVLIGVSQGIGWTAMFAAAGTGVAAEQQGTASALASTTQQVGAAVGLAVLVAVAAGADSTAGGLRLAGVIAGVVTVVSALLVRFVGPSQPAAEGVAAEVAAPRSERVLD